MATFATSTASPGRRSTTPKLDAAQDRPSRTRKFPLWEVRDEKLHRRFSFRDFRRRGCAS